MIKPEELKLIAEGMGYERPIIKDNRVEVNCRVQNKLPTTLYEIFNPYTNAEQREEILLYLFNHGWEVYESVDYGYCFSDTANKESHDKDYTIALFNAALKEIKG